VTRARARVRARGRRRRRADWIGACWAGVTAGDSFQRTTPLFVSVAVHRLFCKRCLMSCTIVWVVLSCKCACNLRTECTGTFKNVACLFAFTKGYKSNKHSVVGLTVRVMLELVPYRYVPRDRGCKHMPNALPAYRAYAKRPPKPHHTVSIVPRTGVADTSNRSVSILSPGQGLRTRAKRTTGKQGLRYTPRPEAPHCLYCPQDRGCGHVPNALRYK
jgi:hypothetical protein